VAGGEGLEEDLVLAEEPGQRPGPPAIAIAPITNVQKVIGSSLRSPPMLADVLLARGGAWITAPEAEEEERLEEGMGCRDGRCRRRRRPTPHRQEHVAELRHRRVREARA